MKYRALLACLVFAVCLPIRADILPEVHFLIPAGPGGGWDGTARGVGEALTKSRLVEDVSFENLSGGGGGRAIGKLIETAERQQYTMLISSTPMVVRSLQKIFPQSFRDLRPVASVIADYSCFVVRKDSPLRTWKDVVAAFVQDPRRVKVAGGSVRGSTDHIIFAKAIELAGGDPFKVIYVPYDGGGKAMAGILTGETQILSTGLSEAIDMARAGEARIVAVTANERLADAPDVPTLAEQGIALEFANWRGFFAAKGLPEQRYKDMEETIATMLKTPDFETVRARNGWTVLHHEGDAFYQFLEHQEQEIGSLMRQLGFLKN
jgi:putative tricarboxylic transport membrane protein